MRLILSLLLLTLVLHMALPPTQAALGVDFGLTPTVEPANITPVPEPPTATPEPPTVTPPATTIPPLAPFPPIAPRTERAFLPVVMRAECAGGTWIFMCEAVR